MKVDSLRAVINISVSHTHPSVRSIARQSDHHHSIAQGAEHDLLNGRERETFLQLKVASLHQEATLREGSE